MTQAGTGTVPGKVWLVGAGPGDAGLLTLKGRDVLSKADVVVYDALVGDGVLAFIPETAEQVFAGKRAGHHYMRQEDTNRLLLTEAVKGKRVVRLKGGDPFLFGRGGEELELLSTYEIPYEVVPGITSAFAVPAYNGIPVTHRDFCSSVHIITGHRRADHTYDIDFDALKRTGGTLVFLMGIASLPDICSGLLEAGMDPSTPAAVLECGTTADQHRICGTLGTLAGICASTRVLTPAIIAVGQVCALAGRFSWAESRPLAGIKAVVTRQKDRTSRIAEMLRERGAEVIENPAIETVPAPDDELDAACRGIAEGTYGTVVFNDPISVRIFMRRLLRKNDIRVLGSVTVAAVGGGTAGELKTFGLRPDAVLSSDGRNDLDCEPDSRASLILHGRADDVSELASALSEAGGPVTRCAVFDMVFGRPEAVDLTSEIDAGEIDYAVFTSVSTVRGFAASCPGADLSKVRAVCIGRQTADAASALGMSVLTAQNASLASLAEALEEAAKDNCNI
ncbi:MAG: uroporphyrinogen-III C-methyltransferase [Eubacteriaceae bacterium]|nr:uroporphyrinogen-III C-methyltransferase [Eubacteriaceae bacterium]